MSKHLPGFAFKSEHIVDIFLRASSHNTSPTVAEVQRQVEAMLVGPFAPLQPQIGEIVSEILRRIDVRIGARPR